MEKNRAWKEQAWRHLLGEMSESEASAFEILIRADEECCAVYRECAELLAEYAEAETHGIGATEQTWDEIESRVLSRPKKGGRLPWLYFGKRALRSRQTWVAAACILLGLNVFQMVWIGLNGSEGLGPRQLMGPGSSETPVRLSESPVLSGFASEEGEAMNAMKARVEELEQQRDGLVAEVSSLEDQLLSVMADAEFASRRFGASKASVFVMNNNSSDRSYGNEVWSYLKGIRETPGVSLAFASERTRSFLEESEEGPSYSVAESQVLADMNRPMTISDIAIPYAFVLINDESNQALIAARNMPVPSQGERFDLWAKRTETQEYVKVGTVPEFGDLESVELAVQFSEDIMPVDSILLTSETEPTGNIMLFKDGFFEQGEPLSGVGDDSSSDDETPGFQAVGVVSDAALPALEEGLSTTRFAGAAAATSNLQARQAIVSPGPAPEESAYSGARNDADQPSEKVIFEAIVGPKP